MPERTYSILVVEDDPAVRNLVSTALESRCYRHTAVATGKAAIASAATNDPDIVLLDLGLPDMDGVDVIKRIRTWSNMPIIVLSARSEDADKIEALDAGADDYLSKPFSVGELLARLRATERLVKELLPVIDDMERAITYADADAPASSVLAGITAIRDKMLGVLAKEKVSPVDPTGQPFDALIHQAVGRVEDDSVPDETVMQVYQKGYDMAGRCIRPAMVTVSSGGPARDKE